MPTYVATTTKTRRGHVYHAVDEEHLGSHAHKALCGHKPTGWAWHGVSLRNVTCPRCLKKLRSEAILGEAEALLNAACARKL